MSDSDENRRLGANAAIIVLGLVLAAFANTLDITPMVQLVLGLTAAALLLWVLVRAARK